jgi:hypothetical protein
MRLSEAIRLGAMLHPQAFQSLRVIDMDTGAVVRTCALGAAEQAGYNIERESAEESLQRCPACPPVPFFWSVNMVIAHLNDDHRWTRERIADWVETLEPAAGPVCDAGAGGDGDACSPAGNGPPTSQRGQTSLCTSSS